MGRPRPRAGGLQVGGRPQAISARGVREGCPVGRRRLRRGGAAGRRDVPDSGRQHGGARPRPGPGRHTDRVALFPLRRAAAARRGRLDLPGLGADRARRPLVRARRGRLQGQHRHAPDRAAGAEAARRRLPVRRQDHLRGLRGAGHRRSRGIRPAERGASARGHDPGSRHWQLRRRRSHPDNDTARHDECGRHAARAW